MVHGVRLLRMKLAKDSKHSNDGVCAVDSELDYPRCQLAGQHLPIIISAKLISILLVVMQYE